VPEYNPADETSKRYSIKRRSAGLIGASSFRGQNLDAFETSGGTRWQTCRFLKNYFAGHRMRTTIEPGMDPQVEMKFGP
jgi:hypothetical protein